MTEGESNNYIIGAWDLGGDFQSRNLDPDTFKILCTLAVTATTCPQALEPLAFILASWLAWCAIDNHLRRPPSGLAPA